MFKLCIFVGSCYIFNSYKHYSCHLNAVSVLNNLTVCYISDTTMCAECLTSSWGLTEMLHTLQCQFTAQCSPTYTTLLHKRHHDASYLLSLLENNFWLNVTDFAAHCSPNYITLRYVNDTTTCPTCRVSSWKLTRKGKSSSPRTRLEQTLNPGSCNSGFLTFRLSMLSAVFLLFCFSQSVQKLDLSTWSLMCTLCIRTISVCLLRLNIVGNEWAYFDWSSYVLPHIIIEQCKRLVVFNPWWRGCLFDAVVVTMIYGCSHVAMRLK